MYKLLLTTIFLFTISKALYCQSKQGTLSSNLNLKAQHVILKSFGYNIREMRFFNERDTLINSSLFKKIEVEFKVEFTKKWFGRKPTGIIEWNNASLLFKQNDDFEWQNVAYFENNAFKFYQDPDSRPTPISKNSR